MSCCRERNWKGERGMGVSRHANADRKSTRLNSSHGYISYAVFCLKKKKNNVSRFYQSPTYFGIISILGLVVALTLRCTNDEIIGGENDMYTVVVEIYLRSGLNIT